MSKAIYTILKNALREKVMFHNFADKSIDIACKALSAKQAIGNPEHDDYPIIRGKEVMIEADFLSSKGQSFTDEFENNSYRIKDLLDMDLPSNRERASFIAGFNAVYKHLGLIDKTIHCKDSEPVLCADKLPAIIKKDTKVLLIGHHPRFLEKLALFCKVRAIDLNPENIGKIFSGTTIEPEENTQDAIGWCDMIFATGSTIVNNSISTFINADKPAIFFGVTITGPAIALNLKTFCQYGH